MRRPISLLFASVLILPMVALTSSASEAAADAGTSCARSAGAATFSPGLWKLQPPAQAELHELAQTINATGTITGCVGGGVTSGTLTAAFKVDDPANCNTLLSVDAALPPTTGTIAVSWDHGRSSTVAVTLKSVTGKPTQADIVGTVASTSDTFRGLHVAERINLTPEPGGCSTKNLQHVTYKEVTPLKIG
ncbi:MAG: hypothetical protein JWN46_646 [Acidimicrobiales bacterium]|nr:hypothetical protein [Acidimicrobiales bacterium]